MASVVVRRMGCLLFYLPCAASHPALVSSSFWVNLRKEENQKASGEDQQSEHTLPTGFAFYYFLLERSSTESHTPSCVRDNTPKQLPNGLWEKEVNQKRIEKRKIIGGKKRTQVNMISQSKLKINQFS